MSDILSGHLLGGRVETMKYEKPRIFNLAEGDAAPYCGNGTGANSTGCATGISIAVTCDMGAGDQSCWDGSGATYCFAGSSAAVSHTRCNDGIGAS